MDIKSSLFGSHQESHRHSLETLSLLERYDDFMGSLETVYDMGAGAGYDAEWWATRTNPQTGKPYDIQCFALDAHDQRRVHLRHNLNYLVADFEEPDPGRRADLIWSHDSFRFTTNPLGLLKTWNSNLIDGGALMLITPQTHILHQGNKLPRATSYSYFYYDITNLMYMLAVAGFDCRQGHFWKQRGDPWIHAFVYKIREPLDPKTTSLGTLVDLNAFTDSVINGIKSSGELRQEDIFTHWISGHYCRWSEV
jgi:SAM-dependent methyltransferase